MDSRLTIDEMDKNALLASLSWQVEMGCDEALCDDISHRDAMAVSLRDILSSMAPDYETQNKAEKELSHHRSAAAKPASTSPVSGITAPAASASLPSSGISEMMAQITTLDELKAALSSFEGCELKRTATNLVFADGNSQAKIMLIGEAPGKDEDRMGLPFVGSAGQLLDQMLAAINLDRTSVYIANIMPWRPPGNRALTEEEIEMMRPFFEKHISLINPDVIVTLGGTASKTLLKSQEGIMKLRGKDHRYQLTDGSEKSYPLVACLHPGYLLRSPHHKSFAFKDLLTLRRKALELAQ